MTTQAGSTSFITDTAALLGDPVVRAGLMLHSGRLSRTPAFCEWTRTEIINELVVGLLQRFRRFDAGRGHFRSFATVAIRSAASTLKRDQMRKKRVAMREMLSLHAPDRSGQTPLDRLRSCSAQSHSDAVIDQATIGAVLSKLPPQLQARCRRLATGNGAVSRDGAHEIEAIRSVLVGAGFDQKKSSTRASKRRDGRTSKSGPSKGRR